ncbi:UDP-glucose--hexose-1-phosphate uridylyltransferase [Thermoanaerobacter mathranii subsp. mathranii str. A3]|uniref:Galactose-1-phosphate uridylyltransferase n=1 Tax=Thermoanaerobacter mathranii subsp. mathranii (strain DSM 11426 / CCUG 53645 / CIP 108742 / A3) TaxID=583358 RepID=A0ABN3Z3D0_THEM3|nr:UDP-glucose--hexose-1-phosphate uridylyltransferase [Thermoanaerobacter mathranii]ADH61418.1 UDP-glucose--hexose-1-phosphate uridylyltransferase [Thermoanaerobacter mathranii subsp. mathranii str. A3]
MDSREVALHIERLIKFALKKGLIEELDVIPSRNALMDLFKIEKLYEGEVPEEELNSPSDILNKLLDYAAQIGIICDNTITYRDLMDARIMGLLMPRQSEVVKKFNTIALEEGIEKATEYFYKLSQASNYIRMDRIAKNLYWRVQTQYGSLEITINLSKPEKDPKEIEAAKKVQQSGYPKCLLCLENVGFAGNLNHPARQNHRVIPVKVAGEQWYFQYSPYVYYNEHSILFYEKHVPMKISEKTFVRLLDFVEQFPHYFMGSNADLPIVGGSILSHEHFQGGRHVFPMEEAPIESFFVHNEYNNVKVGVLKWPMSVIRIAGKQKSRLIDISSHILNKWKNYNDLEVEIVSHSEKNGELIPHNTITPIARINKNGEFEIDLVLRNNRTTDKYPYGIFHPHEELHHIKKENIGLIEVMGLAVLPGRLKFELDEIMKFLTGEQKFDPTLYDKNHPLYKHIPWVEELLLKYGNKCTKEEAESYIQQEVGNKFLQVLFDAGVFKRDEKGKEAFERFMKEAGFEKIDKKGDLK